LGIQHLYKIHENHDCAKLLNITRYLYENNIDATPYLITERQIPQNIQIPTIIVNNVYISGLTNIVNFFEKILDTNNLLEKSEKFANENPNYRIRK